VLLFSSVTLIPPVIQTNRLVYNCSYHSFQRMKPEAFKRATLSPLLQEHHYYHHHHHHHNHHYFYTLKCLVSVASYALNIILFVHTRIYNSYYHHNHNQHAFKWLGPVSWSAQYNNSEFSATCVPFSGAIAKLRKTAISFVMSVRPHETTRLLLDGF
jgi:hypothetical protein